MNGVHMHDHVFSNLVPHSHFLSRSQLFSVRLPCMELHSWSSSEHSWLLIYSEVPCLHMVPDHLPPHLPHAHTGSSVLLVTQSVLLTIISPSSGV